MRRRCSVPSTLLIVLKMILWDNIVAPRLGPAQNIAYSAHLVGYGFGFITTMLLLWIRALPRDQFDMLALWKRAYQRRAYSTRASANNWTAAEGTIRTARPVKTKAINSSSPEPVEGDRTWQLRREIAEAFDRRDLTTAAEGYLRLLAIDAGAVLARPQQLDVANQLMAQKQYPQAAQAYEKYLFHYATAPQIEQVQLLLGIVYARYLDQPDRARELLQQARERLSDPSQQQLCEQELQRVS